MSRTLQWYLYQYDRKFSNKVYSLRQKARNHAIAKGLPGNAYLCDCCSLGDLVDTFSFEETIGCRAYLTTPTSLGGKVCKKNILFVPEGESRAYLARQRRRIQGDDWSERMLKLRGPRNDGRPVRLPSEER